MAKKISEEEQISKASKGYIKDYYAIGQTSKKPTTSDPNHQLMQPKESFYDLLGLMRDSTFNTEVNVVVDGILKNGWKIVKKEDPTIRDIKKEDKLRTDFRFNQLLRSVYLNLLVYRNCFLEIEYNGKSVKNLHLLETTEMNINVTPHGEILGYTQIHVSGPINPMTGKKEGTSEVYFEPEEAIHISPSKITTEPWGFVDTRAIKAVVHAKNFFEEYIDKLFRENRFRDLFIIKNATSTEQVKNFIDSLKQGIVYRDKDLVVEGDIEQKQLRNMKDLEVVLKVHDEYKSLIREFLRVPPLMTGDVGSNKSTGEFEVRFAFANTIRSWQDIVEDEINNELFPKMGWGNYSFVHYNLDKPDEKSVIEMAVQLKGLGYDDETINKFLIIKGVELPNNAKIKTPEEKAKEENIANPQDDEKILKQDLQNKNAPSRKARDKSLIDTNKTGEKETRDEQIVGKSEDVDFNGYPYIY